MGRSCAPAIQPAGLTIASQCLMPTVLRPGEQTAGHGHQSVTLASVALCLALGGGVIALIVSRVHTDSAASELATVEAAETSLSGSPLREPGAMRQAPSPLEGPSLPARPAVAFAPAASPPESSPPESSAPSAAVQGAPTADAPLSATPSPPAPLPVAAAVASTSPAVVFGGSDAPPAARAARPDSEGSAVSPGQPCGTAVCAPGKVCCNASCGTCTEPGEKCSQLVCGMNSSSESVLCGHNTCNTGQVCCNASCGICTAPGATCDPAPCADAIQFPQSQVCGLSTCNVDTVCCNPSCGICAPPGEPCSQKACD